MPGTSLLGARLSWSGSSNDMGHRVWVLKTLVHVTDPRNDGPAVVMQCPGLPVAGTQWVIGNDLDIWAWCQLTRKVEEYKNEAGQPGEWWSVENTFTTYPPPRCNAFQVQDPLLEPPIISGDSVKYQEEASVDRWGIPLTNSAYEQLRGPQVEFDKNRSQISITMNIPVLNLGFIDSFLNTVNAYPIWGYNPRCVKLSSRKFERKFYGFCSIYYRLTLEFDINTETFDRDILDAGTKVFVGGWIMSGPGAGNWGIGLPPGSGLFAPGVQADYRNPGHYIVYRGKDGAQTNVVLNGAGLPAGVGVGTGTQELRGVDVPCCNNSLSQTGSLTINDSPPMDPNGPVPGSGQSLGFTGVSISWSSGAAGIGGAEGGWRYRGALGTCPSAEFLLVCTVMPAGQLTRWQLTAPDGQKYFDPAGFLPEGSGGPPTITFDNVDLTSCGGSFGLASVTVSIGSGPNPEFSGGPGTVHVEKYGESDLSALGIPLVI